MKVVVVAFNQAKALVGAFSVITNLRMVLFETLGDRGREQGAGRNLSVRMSWAVHWAWRRAGAALSTCLNKKYLQTSRLMRLEVTQLLAPVNKSEIPL